MQDAAHSCLIERMRHYTVLSAWDEELLQALEKDEISYRTHTPMSFSENPSYLFVLKSGWLYRYEELDDKRRQVLRIHYPGDIVGLTDIAMKEAGGEMMTVTNVVLVPGRKSCESY